MKKFLAPAVTFVFFMMIFFVPIYITFAQATGSTGSGGTSGSTGGSGTSGSTGGNNTPINGGAIIENPFKGGGSSLKDLFLAILNNIVLPIGGVVAVLAFVYSGFLYVMAQGDEKKISTAHNALLYTAIGTAVLLGASAIATVVSNTINQLK